MRVEVSHNVDWVPDQNYNYLAYEFFTADSRLRARAYTDTIRQVDILGRLGIDGSLPVPTPAVPLEGAPIDLAAAERVMAALDATKAAEFESILDYLRERFSEVRILGVGGYRKLAAGLSREERSAKMKAVSTETINADLRGPGDAQ